MRKQIRLLLIACSFFTLPLFSDNERYSRETETQEEEGPLPWGGPGLYYGYWFDSEDDYNTWTRNNYHDYRRNHPGDRREEDRGSRDREGRAGRR